ncbi:MAG: glycosyltransferase family 25 protein [Sulfitobacter sp.]
MRSLIIHLSRATARAENVARLLKDLPQAEVVEAVDAQDPAQLEGRAQVSPGLHHPAYPFGLSTAEIACFHSHRHCWELVANGDAPVGLICEDDMTVDPGPFATALELIEQYADEDSFIRLPAKARERPTGGIARKDGATLFMPRTIGLQAVCQVVGRRAARRVLAATEVFDRPVDTTLQMHWITGQPILSVLPNGIAEMGGPSTIQSKTRTSDVLMREVRRATYRAQIRRKPQVA